MVERRLVGPIGAAFLLRGPVWLAGDESAPSESTILAAIRAGSAGEPLVWAPESLPAMHRRPVITGYGTSWLDLALGLDACDALGRGLAHRLRQAEAGGSSCGGSMTRRAADWLLDRNEAHRREVGYRGPSRAFLGRLAEVARDLGELLLLWRSRAASRSPA